MPTRKDDPDLAPDATLATDLGDEDQRFKDQVAEMGGEPDEIDSFDATDLDDGSILPDGYDPLNTAPAKSPDDEGDGDSDDDDSTDDSDDDSTNTATSTARDESSDEGDGDKTADADEDKSDEEGDDKDVPDPDDVDDKPAPKGIPKHRFDEVNERRKAAEEENERLKAELAAGKKPESEDEAFDFDEAEKLYIELTLDGDTDAALAKRKEIRAAERAEWKSETKGETKSEIEQSRADAELLGLSQEAEKMFDIFNPDHEDFNADVQEKVLVFMRGYESTGEHSRSDAFIMGLADVVEMYGLMPPEDDSKDEDPEPKPTGKKKEVDEKKKASDRKRAHQPVAGEGSASADTGAVVPNVDDMTDEELAALPAKTLARLRGDFI